MNSPVDVVFEDTRWEAFGLAALARNAALAVFADLSVPAAAELCVLGCDDARIAALNADFLRQTGGHQCLELAFR
ncbi:MAG: hypothetical protein V9G14_04905 [Cypionkella sp.]